MTRQSPPELFAQRPVRSDFGRRHSPSRITPRRLLAVVGLLIVAVLAGMWINGLGDEKAPENPEAVPNIQAEMPIKQKPEQPGGVDIPHQDVTVFEQIDQKGASQAASGTAEQLLPAPETPQAPPATQPAPAPAPAPVAAVEKPLQDNLPPAVTAAEPVAAEETKPVEAPKAAEEPKPEVAKVEPPKPQTVKAPVTKKLEKAVQEKRETTTTAARLPAELFTTGEIPAAATTQSAATTQQNTASQVPASGKTAQIQLASYPDETVARAELKRFASKYAGLLGGTTLRVISVDLGSKGTYHRIVSEPVSSEKAKALCADIVKQKGSCLLVK